MSSKIQIKKQKRGRPSKSFTFNQINHAIESTQSMKMASEYLNISYELFKKWAKIHNLWNPLQSNKGIKQRNRSKFRPYDLKKILEGENPSPYRETVLLKKCFKDGYLEQSCSTCGEDFSHITDNNWPLVLDFYDKDHKNTKLDNLRALCLNCVYTLQFGIKGWYRHRDIPLNKIIDEELPIHIGKPAELNSNDSSNTLTTTSSDALSSSDTLAESSNDSNDLTSEVDFIPFEEFQKSLEK